MIRGSVPNCRWPIATCTWDELRSSSIDEQQQHQQQPLFVPLPPRRKTPSVAKPSSPHHHHHRHLLLPPPWRVRQDDAELTRALHRGVLTGGLINGILGFAEGGPAAARVGAPFGGSGGGGGGGGGRGDDNKGRNQHHHHRRSRRRPLERRLDPHSAAIEHLKQPRWDLTKQEAITDFLRFEEEAIKTKKKKKTPEEVARAGVVSVRLAWGKSAEAAALRSLVNALRKEREREKKEKGEAGSSLLFRCPAPASSSSSPSPSSSSSSSPVVSAFDARIEEVGMVFVSEEALEGLFRGSESIIKLLPPLAASPDAVVRYHRSSSSSNGNKEEEEQKQSEDHFSSSPPSSSPSSSWFEPVEVKCVCPFRLSGRSRQRRRSGGRAFDSAATAAAAGSGGNNDNNSIDEETPSSSSSSSSSLFARYELSDPGPRPRPPASSMPQLQLQMLACGSRSALLVSHSATRGSRVFRVARDDAFLRGMLSGVVAPVVARDVLLPGEGGQREGRSKNSKEREHAAGVEEVMRLADAAVAMAAAAEEVAVLPPAEGIDPCRAFLQ